MTSPSRTPTRRSFLHAAATAPVAAAWLGATASHDAAAATAAPAPPLAPASEAPQKPAQTGTVRTPKKSMLVSMLEPKTLPIADRFAIARDAGFVGMEMHTVTDPAEAEAAKAAADRTGVKIHSVMNADHWRFPLSSADPQVVAQSVTGMETSLQNAKLWGADTVLLVPAVVDARTSYADAWTRSQRVIKERLLPLAQDLRIVIAVEEVWNKFLLSPLEFARYVDEFDSPWLRAYFDVGNIVFYGFPQDWIRTLDKRIVRVHLKDFELDRANGRFAWKNIGEGDIDWIEVHKAFWAIGYDGYMTTEIAGGDAAYIADVSRRLDRFFAGAAPA